MTTTFTHASDEVKDFVENNLQDENKLALHHRITIDVLEFIDIAELRNKAINFKDYEETIKKYVDNHRVINSDFLQNNLNSIFDKSRTVVYRTNCDTGNFDLDLYKIETLLSEVKEKLEKNKNKVMNRE